MEDIMHDRPESFLRIQRSDEFAKICKTQKYIDSKQLEVRPLYYGMKKLFNKEGAQTKEKDMVAGHVRAVNKGYPEDFKDYLTYDNRFNIIYKKEEELIDKKKKKKLDN